MCSVYKNLLIGYEFRFTTKMPPIDSIELFRYYYFYVFLFFLFLFPIAIVSVSVCFRFGCFTLFGLLTSGNMHRIRNGIQVLIVKHFEMPDRKSVSYSNRLKPFQIGSLSEKPGNQIIQRRFSRLSPLYHCCGLWKHFVCVCVCARSRANMKLSELKQMRRSVAIFTPEMCNS